MEHNRRRQILDYSIIGIVLVAVVVLFWPFGHGSDDGASGADNSDEVAASTPSQESATASPTDAATPLATAEVSPERESSPAPASTPTPDELHPCELIDTTEIMTGFVERFNEGDFEGLRVLLPDDSYTFAPSLSGILNQPEKFHAFIDRGDSMGDIDEIIRFLHEQHERGERWRSEDVEAHDVRPNQYWRDSGLGEVTATLVRSRAGFELDEFWGHATINCADQVIVVWRFIHEEALDTDPIHIDEFLDGTEPLKPGQMRTTLMEVATSTRVDGGLINRWRVQHDQALDSDRNPLQRILIRSEADRDESMLLISPEGWYLNHRGWDAAGDGPLPVLPLEYELALQQPGLTADLIREYHSEIPEDSRLLMTRDIDEIPDSLRFTRHFLQGEVRVGEFLGTVENSRLAQVVYRFFDERTEPQVSPELRFIGVRVFDSFNPTGFALVPADAISARQYETTDPIANDLDFVGSVAEGLGEVYEFERFGLEFRVEVTPSRGGLYPSARGEDWGPTWDLHSTTLDDRWLRWADAVGAGYPTHAIWDTGRYRFSLTVQSDPVSLDAEWDEDRLLNVVRALSRG